MVSKGVRVVHGGGLLPLALLLLARGAAAQAAPPKPPAPANARPAAAGVTAPTAPVVTAPGAAAGPGPVDQGVTDVPKNPAIVRLEERLNMTGHGLTADEAARRAMATNATIEAKKKALEGTEYGIDAANAGYWPQLKVSASYTRLSHIPEVNFLGGSLLDALNASLPPGTPPITSQPIKFAENSYSFDASLQVPISDMVFKVSHGVASASHARDAAAYDRNATIASVARDARVAYYNWVRAQAQEVIAAAALEQSQGHQRDAENGFAAGLTSKADVLRTQSEVANSMLLLDRAKNNTAIAAVSLDVAMGLPPGQKHDIGEDVFVKAPELATVPTAEASLKEALERRAELKSLDAAGAASREQARSARVANYPRLDAQAAANYANPNQRYFVWDDKFHAAWQAGAVLSWTPTSIPATEAAANTADVKALELRAQRRAVEDGIKIEIEQSIRAAEEANYQIDVLTTSLTSAEEGYRVRRELFRAGRSTLVEVTDAETELTRARLLLADSYVNARIALVQLSHTLGRDATPPNGTGQ